MKVIICNKIDENNPNYFKRAWRIPFAELEKVGWKSIDQSEIKGKLSDFFINNYGSLPKVLFFWNTNTFIKNNFDAITKQNWIKCIYMDDLHQKSDKIKNFRNLILEKFDYIFCTCAYIFPKFFNVCKENQLVWYPHNVNNKFMVVFNENPTNKILLSGCHDKNVYPFRNYVHNLAKKYPIDILPQLSYRSPNHNNYGHNYIKYINNYIASVACCSNQNTPYIVSKFFEIPASGALLLAYDEYVKEPLKELGFIDGENYISANHENVIEKILFITDPNNKEKIDCIRKNGYNLVWSKHTLLNRIDIIENIVNKY